MSRKKSEPRAIDVKPDGYYAVDVLRPIDLARGVRLLPRHINVRLTGSAVLANAARLKVIAEVERPSLEE